MHTYHELTIIKDVVKCDTHLKNFKAGNFNLFESVVFLFQKINDTESWNAVYLPNSQMFDLSGMQKLICVPFAHPHILQSCGTETTSGYS